MEPAPNDNTKLYHSMSQSLHFYHAMSYPTPTPEEWFWFDKKSSEKPTQPYYASRPIINTTTKELITYINQHTWLYASIPFVTHIYLCNSLTFNAATPDSDIDITFLTHTKRIRTTKFYSSLFFRIKNIKRNHNHHSKRFCLSFYIEKNRCNLYHIKRPHTDHYLTYRIAHLVPLRTKAGENPHHMLQENSRIVSSLPNLPSHLPIQFDPKWPYNKTTTTKKILEKLHHWRWGDLIEQCIKYLRLPIMRYKQKKHKKNHGIITSDYMLKFHYDKRDIIYDVLNITKQKTISNQ